MLWFLMYVPTQKSHKIPSSSQFYFESFMQGVFVFVFALLILRNRIWTWHISFRVA